METAGGAVGPAAELPAGVELRVDQLDTRQAALGLDVDRDAPPVVAHLDRPVWMELDLDQGAVSGQRLVDRVVDDLPQAVHEATAVG